MSKQETVIDFYTNSAPIWPEHFDSVTGVFSAWVIAFERSQDQSAPEAAQTRARTTLEKLWDTAMGLPIKSAPDMAAIYIMGQNTLSIDAYSYVEKAWCIAHTASGEAELSQIYQTWFSLRQTLEESDMGDAVGDSIGKALDGIEAHMAAIPATTAKGLAIKVDVSRNYENHTALVQSLNADLAALTGVTERPE